MTASDIASDLQARLLTIIDRRASAALHPAELDQLAADIFRYQYECNGIYRAYCDARGMNPSNLTSIDDVPAVPTDAFKAAPLSCGDPRDAAAVFRTSGTTGGVERRGMHVMMDTMLYRRSLRAGFRRHLVPDGKPVRIASFVPSALQQPDSSLSFMVREVIDAFGLESSEYFASTAGLRIGEFLQVAHDLVDRPEPLLIIGTSFAFVHLFDELDAREIALSLPPGSRVMDTGGFKGRSREIARSELYDLIARRLGIPASHVVNEYGMTEMSSQMYDGIVGSAPPEGSIRTHFGPPWLRTSVVDPESLSPLPDGATGILRHVDLANLHSVMALQTADLGRVDHSGRIELLGRPSDAEPRGCSIAMDELLELMRSR